MTTWAIKVAWEVAGDAVHVPDRQRPQAGRGDRRVRRAAPGRGPRMSARAGRVRWLGHSTVLLEMDGARLLTDPVLRPWVLHLRRAAPLVAEDLLERRRGAHLPLHYDHLDLPSLQRLDRGVSVVVPKGAGAARPGPGLPLGRGARGRRLHPGRAGARSRGPRRARLEPGAGREVGRTRLRRRGLPARLLPWRHRPLPGDGEPRARVSTSRSSPSGAGGPRSGRGISTLAGRPKR